ncbi:MAG: DUF5107 domain-containing protein, partial [Spirochaetales bacterium]|nr:DUF5107 domain-containing protein [Spirochaetales bacterium]
WEGGEGRALRQFALASGELGRAAMEQGDLERAESLLTQALTAPENLGEGKLPNAQDNMAHYYLGCLMEKAGRSEEALFWWDKASRGLEEPSEMLYYNDQPSDTIYYQALAWEKLGDRGQAKKRYHKLIRFGEQMSFKPAVPDYFAVSLPEITVFQRDGNRLRLAECAYLRSLGYEGLGERKRAAHEVRCILETMPDHQGSNLLDRYWEGVNPV